jgi:L-asparaginase II
MLAKAGRDPGCLECGSHWPMNEEAARALARTGAKPSAHHNNCSGKHAGFVCLSCSQGVDPTGYVNPDHAVQRAVKRAMEEMTGVTLGDALRGVDGCSIPTYATPIVALARAFARLGTGKGLPGDRAAAARRLREAAAAHPFMVAGSGRFDTRLMGLLGARVFSKTGAEGVYCAALPDLGLGIALKCDDGQGRAAEVLLAAAIQRFLPLQGDEARGVADLAGPVMKNWNGIEVGRLRAVALA